MTIFWNVKSLRLTTVSSSPGRKGCAPTINSRTERRTPLASINPPEAAGRSMQQLPRLIQQCTRRLSQGGGLQYPKL